MPTDFLTALLATIIEQRAEDGSSALEVLVQDTGEGWLLKGVGEPVRVMAPLVAPLAVISRKNFPERTISKSRAQGWLRIYRSRSRPRWPVSSNSTLLMGMGTCRMESASVAAEWVRAMWLRVKSLGWRVWIWLPS